MFEQYAMPQQKKDVHTPGVSETVKEIVSILEIAVTERIPITDGLKRSIWTWCSANPSVNPIRLYKEIVRHPNEKIRKIELGWSPIQTDTAEDESREIQIEQPCAKHEFVTQPSGLMFQ